MFIILAGLHFISIFQGFKTLIATKQCPIILKSVAERNRYINRFLISEFYATIYICKNINNSIGKVSHVP